MRIVLASASPRRRELLAQLGFVFEVVPANLDESVAPDELPVDYVGRLAREKAGAVEGDLVIAADTTVDVDGRILGKPADADDAKAMLRLLSGRPHHVHTGVAVRRGSAVASAVTTTWVTFAALDEAAIDWYVATGEPFDKAGAYAIQGAGGVFVESVTGSVSGVIGLPLATLVELCRSVGVNLLGR